MDEINPVEDPAERIRQHVDAALTRSMENPAGLSPASLVRVLRPVIEKHLASGMALVDIAAVLRSEGYVVTKGHLVRHLGIIRAELGMPPMTRGRPVKAEKPAKQSSPPTSTPAVVSPPPLRPTATPAPTAPPVTPTAGAKNDGAAPWTPMPGVVPPPGSVGPVGPGHVDKTSGKPIPPDWFHHPQTDQYQPPKTTIDPVTGKLNLIPAGIVRGNFPSPEEQRRGLRRAEGL
ncbi:hypothetical protein THIX_100003 [Thiomonas sp. X19]|uniref:hypothetical protein n=1 Tax=Thiomonas sp. X19 TaxID=1050370 RepID=UPI000B6F5C6F|nr:hypothetical protein [Thiomonas sp. X19]SCC91699.1 hypothetical protein THIX_100003 [Thiomonas sp. X19]